MARLARVSSADQHSVALFGEKTPLATSSVQD
jgi:hypothetical protein